ncbi:hypothetical protein [Stenoxybacter acetivorans]|uniref:hypothetical protein n=1 Tax=Stenoxybacter acetivorans TaxID=422441 RepID=UPI00056D26EF|nr:hypothetical protein [Stenoxybacter acetivorans]
MTRACIEQDNIQLTLSKAEALVLFEWLARNWEKTQWNVDDIFIHPAEKAVLIDIEGSLVPLLDVVFRADYDKIVEKAYQDIYMQSN